MILINKFLFNSEVAVADWFRYSFTIHAMFFVLKARVGKLSILTVLMCLRVL